MKTGFDRIVIAHMKWGILLAMVKILEAVGIIEIRDNDWFIIMMWVIGIMWEGIEYVREKREERR